MCQIPSPGMFDHVELWIWIKEGKCTEIYSGVKKVKAEKLNCLVCDEKRISTDLDLWKNRII